MRAGQVQMADSLWGIGPQPTTVPDFSIERHKGKRHYGKLAVRVKVKGEEEKWFPLPVEEYAGVLGIECGKRSRPRARDP